MAEYHSRSQGSQRGKVVSELQTVSQTDKDQKLIMRNARTHEVTHLGLAF